MALAQIALAGLTQYIDIKRLFERRLHPMAKNIILSMLNCNSPSIS